MWPEQIQRDEFLIILYGKHPELTNIEITSVAFSRDGPSAILSFSTDLLPKNPPEKWGRFDRVSFSFEYSGLQYVRMLDIGRRGYSKIECKNDMIIITGVMDLQFNYTHCLFLSASPFIQNID